MEKIIKKELLDNKKSWEVIYKQANEKQNEVLKK